MPRGFGGGFRRGGFGRGGFGMGGMGMGMGMGMGPLMTGMMAGGLGYLLGSNTANQQPQVQQVPVPVYPPYQASQTAPVSTSSADEGILAQLKLLGELHDSGVLTDDEFAREKQRLLKR